jgi:death-on-curing protein
VRDPGLLESALHRPTTGYYEDLAGMAAALFESLLMNHPFIDGNKRVAFFATDVFLRLNGWRLRVDPDDAHSFLIGLLERRECDFAHLVPWIRGTIVKS